MATTQKYTGTDIVVLSDRDHCRIRTSVYLGSMHPTVYHIPLVYEQKFILEPVEFIPAALKAVNEIIDNALDEFAHISTKSKTLTIHYDTSTHEYQIKDNGRGIPIDKHITGKYTPEVALASLKAGRNFTDDKKVGVIGQNGVGAACTNYCSTSFEVTILRDKQKYHQKFTNGAKKISKPVISNSSSTKTGTAITFTLDPAVFSNPTLPLTLIHNRAVEVAMCNPDVTVDFNGEKIRFKRGMVDYIDHISSTTPYFMFKIQNENTTAEFYVIPSGSDADEGMYTWVNSSYLYDGGKCNTQFFNAFFDKVQESLAPMAKKYKCEITRNHIKPGIVIFANIHTKNPEYDSQAKTRLTGPDLKREITQCIDENWKSFSKKCDGWLNAVVERAAIQYHISENKKAVSEHMKRTRVSGLLDATNKMRHECQLLITEGLSAKSQVSEARNPKTTAAFALTGKINNVYGCTPAQLLKMGKLGDLLTCIGLVPGTKAIRSNLNYGKIIIATDADHDGGDIFTLLVNLFYQFWPELFDRNYEPFIYRLVAPNICAVRNSTRKHFSSRAEYEAVKHKYKNYSIQYYKGLGAMDKVDWEIILSEDSNSIIPIIDDGNLADTLKLLFSNNADDRKKWLTT